MIMGLIEPTGEKNLSRRTFIVTGLSATGGLMLGVAMPGLASAAMLPEAPWSNDAHAANEINAWIVIDPDETITIRIPHSEMGQGAGTANPMLVAEELECDWSKVKGEFASPNRNVRENNVYKDQNTVGSRGVATSWQYLQQAGASARVRLVQAAANRWNVPASECVAENGAVLHKASSRSLTYGKLAADAAKIALDKEPAIKSFDQLKLLGKPLPRLDTPVKVEVIEERFRSNPEFVAKFNTALPGQPINLDTIASAIAAFERTLVPGPAPFDRWIEGDEKAIPESAKRGFALFAGKAICFACHSGWRFTDD
jgi:hypothetical protein